MPVAGAHIIFERASGVTTSTEFPRQVVTLDRKQILTGNITFSGGDLRVVITKPDGHEFLVFDDDDELSGEQPFAFVALSPGDYVIELQAPPSRSQTIRYNVTSANTRRATEIEQTKTELLARLRTAAQLWETGDSDKQSSVVDILESIIGDAEATHLTDVAIRARLDAARAYVHLKQPARAERHYKALANTAADAPPELQGKTYEILGYHAENQAQSSDAILFFSEAACHYRAAGHQLAAANVINFLAEAHRATGNLAIAKHYYNDALITYSAARDTKGATLAMEGLCALAIEQRDWQEAEEFAQIALERSIADNDTAGEGQAFLNLGLIRSERYESRDARAYLIRALHKLDPAKNTSLHMSAVNSLAILDDRAGEYEAALQGYRQAYERAQDAVKPAALTFLANAAGLEEKLGRYDEAERLLEEVIEEHQKLGDRRSAARTRSTLGSVLVSRREYRRAITHLEQAIMDAGREKDELTVATAQMALGAAYENVRAPQRAREMFEGARDIFRRHNLRAPAAMANVSLHRIIAESGGEDAMERMRSAIRDAEATGEDVAAMQMQFSLGVERLQSNDIMAAVTELRECVRRQDKIATTLLEPSRRADFAKQYRVFTQAYVDALRRAFVTTGDTRFRDEAFLAGESYRARGLLHQIAVADVGTARQGTDAEAPIAEIAALVQKRLATSNRVDRADYLERARVLLREVDRLDDQAAVADERFRQARLRAPATVKEVQGALEADETLLQYLFGVPNTYLWAVTRDEVVLELLPSGHDLDNVLRAAQQLLAARSTSPTSVTDAEVDGVLRAVGDKLLGAVAQHLRPRLLISADGELHGFPLSVAMVGGSYIASKHTVTMLPAARLLLQKPAKSIKLRSAVVVADPIFGATDTRVAQAHNADGAVTLPRLTSTGAEAFAVRRQLQGAVTAVLLGEDANRAAVRRALATNDIVHIATHALVVPEEPRLTALVLSQKSHLNEPIAGMLTATDVMHLPIHANVVVLNACDTARGTVAPTEAMKGLAYAFLYAGSQQVISTAWPVDDKAAAVFAEHLYKHLLQEDVAEALTSAQRAMRDDRRFRSPAYWGAFLLTRR